MEDGPRTLRIEIAPRTLLFIVLIVAGGYLTLRLSNVVLVVIVSLVLVGTFDLFVGLLVRCGWGRGRAQAQNIQKVEIVQEAVIQL